MEESLIEPMRRRLREILLTREWLEKALFGDAIDVKSDPSDIFLKYYGISKDLDWEHEYGVVLRSAWKTGYYDKQDSLSSDKDNEDFRSSKCNCNDYEEDEDEYSEGDSEDYDYDYADCSEYYHEIFEHRLSLFLHEELPMDKKRNPTLLGKQLIMKSQEEGKEIDDDVFINTQAGKEASESLFKNFADYPRTVLYMARISHSLS